MQKDQIRRGNTNREGIVLRGQPGPVLREWSPALSNFGSSSLLMPTTTKYGVVSYMGRGVF